MEIEKTITITDIHIDSINQLSANKREYITESISNTPTISSNDFLLFLFLYIQNERSIEIK
jgi:hypothetical protein